jgi:signal peptidase II
MRGAGTTRPARLGFPIALITLVLDQGSKLYLLFGYDLPVREPLALAPFLDLMVVWNRGISYGLLQQDTELGRWVLLGISVAAAVGLSVWMARATSLLLAAALGLIVGGALGNAVDRIAYGAVFDFVHFHVGSFSWYVFNIADAAIVAGVVGLVYDTLFLDKRRGGQGNPEGATCQAAISSPKTGLRRYDKDDVGVP